MALIGGNEELIRQPSQKQVLIQGVEVDLVSPLSPGEAESLWALERKKDQVIPLGGDIERLASHLEEYACAHRTSLHDLGSLNIGQSDSRLEVPALPELEVHVIEGMVSEEWRYA